MNYKRFEKKIKTMTAYGIIMAMVNGLRNPRTIIDMATYGRIDRGRCYGCAATNAILQIMKADKEEMMEHIRDRKYATFRPLTLKQFEVAIDFLREGKIYHYNRYAEYLRIAKITPMPGLVLPLLRDNYTEEELQQYEKLAKYQLTT